MIKFAIAGCGRIGQRHAQHINNVGKLRAVCDVKEDRADGLGKQYKCHSYHSLEQMLKDESDVDIVAICTPNGLHAKHTIQALRANFHVLCEKPMALTVSDCGK